MSHKNKPVLCTVSLDSTKIDEANLGKGFLILYFDGEETVYENGTTFTVNKSVLNEIVTNWKNGVFGQEIAWDYAHDSYDKASGWVKNVYLSDTQKELLLDIQFTPAAAQAIRDKEWQYQSIEFYPAPFTYQSPVDGKEYTNLLVGGGLTNRPFMKKAKVSLSQKNKKKESFMKKDELIVALKENHSIDVVELQEKIQEASAKLAELSEVKGKLELAEQKVEKLEKEAKEEKIEALYVEALSEGKIVPENKAMLSTYLGSMKLESAKEYVQKMPKILSMSRKSGSGESQEEGKDARSLLHEKILEKQKEHPELSYEAALKIVGGR